MADRIIDLARYLAAASNSPEAQELLDLIGEDGDPHPRAARHSKPSKNKKDTTLHSKIDSQVPQDTVEFPYDENYKPGVGFYLRGSTFSNWNHRHDQQHKGAGHPKLQYQSDMRFISEDQILGMAEEIVAGRGMVEATERYLEERRKEVSHGYPGTDAIDSGKHELHSASDDHNIDHSESTIFIGQCDSSGTFLNGSAVKHGRFVHIEIHGPDGRELVDVSLSMEQFAAALTSRMNIPCTLSSYWSAGPGAVRLTERVRTPPSIIDRMRTRIDGRIDEMNDRLHKVKETLAKAAEAGKPMNKTALAALARDMGISLSHIKENASFATQQAVEEVSAVVESAVMHIGQQHGIGLDVIAKTPEIMHSIEGAIALPAPK